MRPGSDPAFVCETHLAAARNIASAMGFVLGVIDLTRECVACGETQVFMGDGKWSCRNGHYGVRSKEEFVLDKLWANTKCKNCGHRVGDHGRLGCTSMPKSGAFGLLFEPECGCVNYEPMQEKI